ncbi:MAG: hypothetical protein IKN43_14380 [Selenomonadaceae bacterium]|nr:hypothetical protein [Selenomonadaceae bacterium]
MENEEFQEKPNLVHDMNEQIKELGEKDINIVKYWQETIDIIKETMYQTQNAQNYARIIRTWCAGINKLEETFDMNRSEDVKKIFDMAGKMAQDKTLEKNVELLDKLYTYITELDWRTDKIFEAIKKFKHENPLLALPAIRKAPPLKKEMIGKLKPNELYLSATKAIILQDDNIDPVKANKEVCLLLKKYNVPKAKIAEALLASPVISHLRIEDKKEFIVKELAGNLGNTKNSLDNAREACR